MRIYSRPSKKRVTEATAFTIRLTSPARSLGSLRSARCAGLKLAEAMTHTHDADPTTRLGGLRITTSHRERDWDLR